MARISFSVPSEDFEQELRSGLQRIGRQVRMKGFRPGKIPPHVLEKQFGEQVRKDVMEHFLRAAYQQAVEQESLDPISHPQVSQEDLSRAEDGSFGLDFEVSLKPSFELPDYKGMVIESELEPVLAEQVEATLEQLRRERSTPRPVSEEGLRENGMAVGDVAFLHEGEVVLEREGLRLAIHTPPPGVEADVFEETMTGAREGDVRECAVTLPGSIEREEARGAQGTCRVTVREAYDMVPPEDEELFELLDVENSADLQARIRERLEEAAARRERDRVEGALLDRLMERTEFELPAPMLEEQTRHRLHALATEMQRQEVPPEAIEQQLEEQRETARDEAEKGMRALLVVEALGAAEELLVTNEELEAELATIAERNDTTIEEVREYYAKNNLAQQMAIEVLERKVRAFLYENAEVREPS